MKNIIVVMLTLLVINSFGQVKNSIGNNVSNAVRIATTDTTVYIPVVVHVIASGQANEIFPTDPQIIAKIAELNSIFNGSASFLGNPLNIGIQFRLATLSPTCTSTNGIDRLNYQTNIQYKNSGVQFETRSGISEVELKMNTRWETSQYLNIWIVNKIDGVNSGAYTWLPADAAGKDGIVITSSDFMLPNFHLLVNQMGRFFNLYTLWELLGSPGTSVFCGNDDVADTDPVEAYSGPARTGINPCTTEPYDDRTEYNFMSHNNFRRQFTQGQKVRMRGALQLPNRKSLVNSITDEFSSCIFNNANTPVFTHNTTPVNLFKTLGIGKGGYIYAGTANQGLYKFNGHKWTKLSILSNTLGSNIGDIKTDKNGGIWIAQYGHTFTEAITGGLNYLPDSTEIGHIQYSPVSGGLPTRNCRAIFIDTTSSLPNPRVWTANFSHLTALTNTTGAVGLGLNNTSPNFTSITAGIDVSTQTTSVQTIGGDNNEVWAFVSGNFNKSQILSYNSQTAAFKKAYNNTDIHASLSNTFNVRSIFFEKYKYFDEINLIDKVTDRRWVAVGNGGVMVYEKPLNQVAEGTWTYVSPTTHPTKFPAGATSFVNTNSITSDDVGNIYFGTTQGLVVFTGGNVADSSNYQRFTNLDGLPSNNVLDIVYSPGLGKIIIATAGGIVFWSKEKFKKNFETFNLTDLIVNSTQANYTSYRKATQANYTVPKEATIHRYFTVKNKSTDNPQKGVYVVYKISNSPDAFLISDPSDNEGVIDLNFRVGGSDINTSIDDYIAAGTNSVSVSFVEAYDENLDLINSNSFNPFIVSVIDKAPFIKEEFGKTSKYENDYRIKAKLPEIAGIKLGGATYGIGINSNPAVIITPKSQDIWFVKASTPNGFKFFGELKPSFAYNAIEYSVGELSGKLDLAKRGEYGYNLNLNTRSHCYLLASKICLLESNPISFLFKTYFERLYRGIDTVPITTERDGLNFEIEKKASLGTKSVKIKADYSNAVTQGNVFASFTQIKGRNDATYNYESSVEYNYDEATKSLINNYSAKASINSGIQIGGGFDGTSEKNKEKGLQLRQTPVIFDKQANDFKVSVEEVYGRHDNLLKSGVIEFLSEKNKLINNEQYTLSKINNYKYTSQVLTEIKHEYLTKGSFSPSYFVRAKDFLPDVSMVSPYTDETNLYKQITDFNQTVLDNFQTTWNEADVKISTKRKITKSYEGGFDFDPSIFPIRLARIDKSWHSYTHLDKEFYYDKEKDKLLLTVDYPDIETNLTLPNLANSNPFDYFNSKLNAAYQATSIIDKNLAISFATISKKIIGAVLTILSNSTPQGQINRLSLDAQQIGTVSKEKDSKNTTTSVPSVFTFTIPPAGQAFITGTSIDFLYYYPENQLHASTVADTFKLITDTFFLKAVDGTTELNIAPLGNFTINTLFSSYELELAGLPNNLIPRVLFLPNSSEIWEDIGAANQTINFNRLGVFALGVGLQDDFESPTIEVNAPSTFTNNDSFVITVTDSKSGIDWSKTTFICNGAIIPITRNGTSNSFSISIASVPKNSNNTFNVSVYTSDLAFHKQEFNRIYPCASSISFLNILEGISSTPNKQQASVTIEISGSAATKPPLEIKAGKNIILNPGFEAKPISGEYFKANIGGCN